MPPKCTSNGQALTGSREQHFLENIQKILVYTGVTLYNCVTDGNGDTLSTFNSFAYTEFATPTDLFSFMIIDDMLQESVTSYPDIWAGQLNISMDFTDGQEGVISLRAHSEVETRVPEPQVSIPEPASLFLFGIGLLAIVGYERRKIT